MSDSEKFHMRRPSISASSVLARPIDADFARAWVWAKQNPGTVLVVLGIVLRLLVYAQGRSLWMDEASLLENLKGKPVLDFSSPLTGDQLAPLGFMITQRALIAILGASRYAVRLLPLFCGIGSLLIFAHLACRILSRRAALVALILFALSDDLIYYSSELKPYSQDLFMGLAITVAAVDSLGKPATGRRAAALALLALMGPWFSFASAFILAGCGGTLILESVVSGRIRDAGIWTAIGAVWLVNLGIAYQVSSLLLSPYTTMYLFWDFAFLPVWPLPMDHARLAAASGILLEIFVNPLNLVAPFWPSGTVVLPLVLLVAGTIFQARRSWPHWMILVLPIVAAVVASAMKRYPLHGRLMLELVPALFLLIAAGTDWVWNRLPQPTKPAYFVMLAVLLAYPCLTALRNTAPVSERDSNRHGDVRKNLFMT